jgi:hypothetical protein
MPHTLYPNYTMGRYMRITLACARVVSEACAMGEWPSGPPAITRVAKTERALRASSPAGNLPLPGDVTKIAGLEVHPYGRYTPDPPWVGVPVIPTTRL